MVTKVECEESRQNYSRFVAEPLDKGWATTLGNALRRVLLSSLPGAAVTWVRIEGVAHEFSVLPFMKEDVMEFLLNVKGIRLRPLSGRPGRLFLDFQGEGEVTAGHIQKSGDFEIANPELHLATLDAPQARLSVELNAELGKGYLPVEKQRRDNLPEGAFSVDAIFTPVRKANFIAEPIYVQEKEAERLVLEVWTDGTISPQEAVGRSAEILIEQLSPFKEWVRGVVTVVKPPTPQQYPAPIEELGLSVRTRNALKRAGINTVGELISRSELELLALPTFGEKAIEEVKEKLQLLGLTLWKGKE